MTPTPAPVRFKAHNDTVDFIDPSSVGPGDQRAPVMPHESPPANLSYAEMKRRLAGDKPVVVELVTFRDVLGLATYIANNPRARAQCRAEAMADIAAERRRLIARVDALGAGRP